MSKRGGSQGPKGAKAPAKKAAAKVSPRSAAATKAAATRKANQERKEKEAKKLLAELDRWEKKQKAKRSEAAKKGAETRKAKKAAAETQKEKRSAAAKKGAATKAAKKAAPAPAKKAPAKKAPAKKAPAGKLIHAGIKYRRKTHRDTKGTDNLRLEVAIELKAGVETPSPEELNAGMQTYAISRGETLPSWAKRIDVMEWAHAKGRPQFAEDKGEISEALEDFASVIGGSEFQLMG